MLFYLFILVFICITAGIFSLYHYKKAGEKLFAIFWGILLFILYACKNNNVGSDYPTYLKFFDEIYTRDLSLLISGDTNYSSFEIGYVVLVKLISTISHTDIFFTIIMALIMSILPIIVIYKYSSSLWMGIFIFFAMSLYTNSFSMLRQSIAMYICWFSIPYIINRYFLKFLLIIMLAFFFHKTALAFIPIYFLFQFKLSAKFYFFAFIGIVIVYIALLPLITYLTSLLILNDYTDANVSGGYIFLLFLFLCFVFCAYALRKDANPYEHAFLQMLFFSLILQLLATKFNILTRIVDYYKISLIVLLPTVICSPLFRKNRLLVIFLFIMLFILYFYKTNLDNSYSIIPYSVR